MMYAYASHDLVAQWVAEHIPHCERGFANCKAIGVLDGDGRIVAGAVYHNWEPEFGLIEMSVAALPGSGWYTRETMARMYQYPFLDIGCQMIVLRLKASDIGLQRMLAVTGYTLTRIARFFGRGEDGVIATLTYEDWADNKFNRRFHHHETNAPRKDPPIHAERAMPPGRTSLAASPHMRGH